MEAQSSKESMVPEEAKRLLINWISKQPHLPQDIDEALLERFLCTSKYSIEKCKKRIDKWYTLKTLCPNYFGSGDPTSQEIRDISKVCFSVPLPKYTSDGYLVYMYGILDNDASKFDVSSYMKRDNLILLSQLLKEKNVDFVMVFDVRHLTLSHVPILMPHVNDMAKFSQDVMPIRIKQIHFINSSPFINKVINTMVQLFKEKIRNRVHFHAENFDTLYKFVSQDILPLEYGGKEESIKKINEKWQNEIESLRDWHLKEMPKVTDESKRPAELRSNDLFGVDGTFKSLSVD